MTDTADESGKWTRYWRAGALHSCGCAYQGNYEGAVARFWDAQFARLPDDACIVDLGTGNGAIPLLASAAATRLGRHWDIHGVDLADIDPAAHAPGRFAGIHFHPRTSATALPFADASVQLVTGQYAFEYLPRDAAVAELGRVLHADGGVALVLHARDSELLSTTAEQLEHCRLLFDETRLFEAVDALAGLLAEAATPEQRTRLAGDADAIRARERVNAAAASLSARIAEAATPDILQLALGHASDALQNAHRRGAAATHAYVAAAARDLSDERRRLLDLDAAALDRDGMQQLAASLAGIGLVHASIGVLDHERGVRLGWTLVAHR